MTTGEHCGLPQAHGSSSRDTVEEPLGVELAELPFVSELWKLHGFKEGSDTAPDVQLPVSGSLNLNSSTRW